MYGDFALRLINHRTDRKERIIGVWLAIKKRHWLLWHKTIARVPVCQRLRSPGEPPPIRNVVLEPLSAPTEIQCRTYDILSDDVPERVPPKSELWLILDMVGPVRRVERKVEDLIRRAS